MKETLNLNKYKISLLLLIVFTVRSNDINLLKFRARLL